MRVFTKSTVATMWGRGDMRFILESEALATIARLTAERDEARAAAKAAYERAAAVSGEYMSTEADVLLCDMWREDIRALATEAETNALAGVVSKAVDDTMNEAKPAEQSPCSGCGQPTGGMCWTDCGMSICGAPLCCRCRHVDEKYGWRHEPRPSRKEPRP